MNRNYCKPDENMRPVYAPDVLRIGDTFNVAPTAADYAAAGYKPLSDNDPGLHEQGKHWERTGKIADADTYYFWEYVLVDDPPPPPRVFETADLVEALMEEGVWAQARAWIVEQGMLDLVLVTKEFDETNENFAAGRAALQQALGWTDEEVEELLARCVKEGY